MRLNRLELAIAALGALLLGILLARYALGGPLSSDVVWYVNAGLTGIRDAFILNRYFHVALQTVFVWAAPNPLAGIQIFWAFLLAATCLVLYVDVRLFSEKSTPLHGVLAILILLSIDVFAEWTGIPFVDLTTMLMVMLILMVTLLSVHRQNLSPGLLLVLGALCYLALRTKETSVWALVVLPGLGFTRQDGFRWKLFWKNLGLLALGGGIGVVVLGLLNAIIVRDPLWGLRPSEILAYQQVYFPVTAERAFEPGSGNWYSGFLFASLLVPFLLYLVSGIKTLPDQPVPNRLLWLVPLAGVLFLVATVNNKFGFQNRFLIPVYPVIALLGVQCLDLELPATRRGWLTLVGVLGAGVVLPVGIRFGIRPLVYASGLDFGQWLEIIFQPVLITLLLAALFLSRRTTSWALLAVIFSLAGLLVSPLLANARAMLVEQPIHALTQFDYYPFIRFADQIAYAPGMRVYVSSGIPALTDHQGDQTASMLAADRNELASMFNIYFDTRAPAESFFLSGPGADPAAEILGGRYDYILLTAVEWQAISSAPQTLAGIEARYQVFTEPGGRVVLLKAR
ncbi:MAG: hypothetical protein JXB85_15700 [Anaerolineales bacterium]|nr:hypothetical protein [Anaerolineales bacterium]